jgi:serine/threonine protein kinase
MSDSITEIKIPSVDPEGKWTDITLLLEWQEECYNVYTAKKHGRWLMLKALKQELRGKAEFEDMLQREFAVRYNLAHPHIVMINDLEEVPGLGQCIITDDIYGDSLRKLIKEQRVTPDTVRHITRDLVDAIDYIQTNHVVHHPIRPETIIFTEHVGNLKVIDVGFDQLDELEPVDITTDIRSFGRVLAETLDACPEKMPRLRAIAERCLGPNPYQNVQQLQMAISGNSPRRLYIAIIAVLTVTVALLAAVLIFQP